jgi:hypothetical protein
MGQSGVFRPGRRDEEAPGVQQTPAGQTLSSHNLSCGVKNTLLAL